MQTRSKIEPRRRHTSRWLLGTLAVIVIGALAVAFLLFNGERTATGEPAIPRGAPLASWNENGHGGKYLLQIVDGSTPPAGVQVSGVVASDTLCEPDARGFSHCHNAIKLANGGHISVIDTHLMSRYRCLKPGEAVSLTSINPSWVVATVAIR